MDIVVEEEKKVKEIIQIKKNIVKIVEKQIIERQADLLTSLLNEDALIFLMNVELDVKEAGKCMVTGKQSNRKVLFAKAY